jgi:hypothetical protein
MDEAIEIVTAKIDSEIERLKYGRRKEENL